MKSINSVFIIILLCFYSCGVHVGVTSSTVKVIKNINDKFIIGVDEKNHINNGLWHFKRDLPADPYYNLEASKYYSLIFSNPTNYISNKNFILLERENQNKSTKFMIVKIEADSLMCAYSAKTEKKYIKLRIKLNVPDTLKLKNN